MFFKPAAILAAIGFAGLAAAAPALETEDRTALFARDGLAGHALGLARRGALVKRIPGFLEDSSDRNEVREEIAAGGWKIAYGDLVNEYDVVTFAASITTGTVAGWVDQQVRDQLDKFRRSFSDISEDVIEEAIGYLVDLVDTDTTNETTINGLDVKAGVATYTVETDLEIAPGLDLGSNSRPNYQLYIGLRNPDDATAERT